MVNLKRAFGAAKQVLFVYSFLGGALIVADLFFEKKVQFETSSVIVFFGVGAGLLFPIVFIFELAHKPK